MNIVEYDLTNSKAALGARLSVWLLFMYLCQ
jgi:hypothetical protein